MPARFLISSLCAAALLALIALPAAAGIQPEPFHINKLGAIGNNLESINTRLAMVLAHPPDPNLPSEQGPSNQLQAMANELHVLGWRLDRVIGDPIFDSTLGIPLDTDLFDALHAVYLGAAEVFDQAEAFLATIPPVVTEGVEPQPFRLSVIGVRDAAVELAGLLSERFGAELFPPLLPVDTGG